MRRWTTAATELPRTSEAGCSLRRSVDRGRDLGLAPRMLMTREDQASYPWMHSPMKFGPQQEPRSSSEVGNLALPHTHGADASRLCDRELGAGKSAVLQELHRRGHEAFGVDEDGYGRWAVVPAKDGPTQSRGIRWIREWCAAHLPRWSGSGASGDLDRYHVSFLRDVERLGAHTERVGRPNVRRLSDRDHRLDHGGTPRR